jgi:hypothetical protein
MSTPDPRPWAATGCLLCQAPPAIGHDDSCAGSDPEAIAYLIEELPGAVTRSWTMAGVRYTATPARRAAITKLMPTMTWYQAGRTVNLSFSFGLLVKEIVPQLGVGRWLAKIGHHPLATIAVPDCGCTDPLRCRCDFDGHPHARAHPDLWADYGLFVLRLRRPQGWLDLWMVDIGTGAVVIAEDDIGNDPIPTDASGRCQMGWCDLCDGTRKTQDGPTQRCTHYCHSATPIPTDQQGTVASPDAAAEQGQR